MYRFINEFLSENKTNVPDGDLHVSDDEAAKALEEGELGGKGRKWIAESWI